MLLSSKQSLVQFPLSCKASMGTGPNKQSVKSARGKGCCGSLKWLCVPAAQGFFVGADRHYPLLC